MLISVQDAATQLGVSVKTLRRHVRLGNIRYVITGLGRVRQHIAFAGEDIAEFIEAQRRREMPDRVEPSTSNNLRSQRGFAELRVERAKAKLPGHKGHRP